MNAKDVLLVVALKTDQPNIERRLKTILAAAEPIDPDTEAVVWAKPVEDLVAADLDSLACRVGWDAVARLRVGDVASGGSPSPSLESGAGNGPESPDAFRPHVTDGSPCWCDPARENYGAAEMTVDCTYPSGEFRATALVHWPTGPVPACEMHAQQLVGLSNFLGHRIAVTVLTEPAECVNCVNEAEADRG